MQTTHQFGDTLRMDDLIADATLHEAAGHLFVWFLDGDDKLLTPSIQSTGGASCCHRQHRLNTTVKLGESFWIPENSYVYVVRSSY